MILVTGSHEAVWLDHGHVYNLLSQWLVLGFGANRAFYVAAGWYCNLGWNMMHCFSCMHVRVFSPAVRHTGGWPIFVMRQWIFFIFRSSRGKTHSGHNHPAPGRCLGPRCLMPTITSTSYAARDDYSMCAHQCCLCTQDDRKVRFTLLIKFLNDSIQNVKLSKIYLEVRHAVQTM